MTAVQLVAGLGNPGNKYEQTRHNAGFWFVDEVARRCGVHFAADGKHKSEVARCALHGHDFRLQKPQAFMNCSGGPVSALARFYQIPRAAILIVHDELDLPAGTVRLKKDGGHGGHNGLRDLIPQLGGNDFLRLRIGIGHPGHKADVTGHVLKPATAEERRLIDSAIDSAIDVLPRILAGDIEAAMNVLHTQQAGNT